MPSSVLTRIAEHGHQHHRLIVDGIEGVEGSLAKHARVIVAAIAVEFRDQPHVVLVQSKVKDAEIFRHSRWVLRLWYHPGASLVQDRGRGRSPEGAGGWKGQVRGAT